MAPVTWQLLETLQTLASQDEVGRDFLTKGRLSLPKCVGNAFYKLRQCVVIFGDEVERGDGTLFLNKEGRGAGTLLELGTLDTACLLGMIGSQREDLGTPKLRDTLIRSCIVPLRGPQLTPSRGTFSNAYSVSHMTGASRREQFYTRNKAKSKQPFHAACVDLFASAVYPEIRRV